MTKWTYIRYFDKATSLIIQFIPYICYTLCYNIGASGKFTWLFRVFILSLLFALSLSFLRFPSNFHISNSNVGAISSYSAYTCWRISQHVLRVTRAHFADSLNWIEKRGYGKDTSAMVHHADRYIAVAVRRGSCFIPVIRRLSRGLYLSQLLGSGVNHSVLFLRLISCSISSEFLREIRKK